MRLTQAAVIIYIASTMLILGVYFTLWQAVIPAMLQLDGPDYIRNQQFLIHAINTGLFAPRGLTFISMGLPLVVLALLFQHRSTPFWKWTFAGWVLFTLGCGILTIVIVLPINRAVLMTDAVNPAANWVDLRDRWNMLNALRTGIGGFSLLAYLIGLVHGIPARTMSARSPGLVPGRA